MEEKKENKKSPQAPEYLELIKVLTEMGYGVIKFENVTPKPDNPIDEIKPIDTIYELRIIHCS